MTQSARVDGHVEYRLGDGPMLQVPFGEIEVDVGNGDVTLSWGRGDTRQSAAMPSSDFARYLASKTIVLRPGAAP